MWNNYFFQIQKKYIMRVSKEKPLVIRLDGKDVTKNKSINIFYEYNGGFAYAMKNSAKYFSKRYSCICVFGSDEISFVFPNPNILIDDLDSDKSNFSNEIIAIFAQYFFEYFNNLYKGDRIYWHAKCFSIPEGKIQSYIKYRSGIIRNVMVTYFLLINNINMGNQKLNKKIEKCMEFENFKKSSETINGTAIFNGDEISLNKFIEENKFEKIIECNGKIDEFKNKKNTDNDDFEIDLSECK